MTATRPIWRPWPVALDALLALREAQSREQLRRLVEPRESPDYRRRVTRRTMVAGLAATLCIFAVVALYLLVIGQLGVPAGADPFGG